MAVWSTNTLGRRYGGPFSYLARRKPFLDL